MPNKILVVEDEPDLILVIVERLKTAGYDVDFATNGRLALEQIKNNLPDLIITDVIMPELDGFGLFKELQKNTATAKIPVIILTARGKMADTFESLGVADFLPKPFNDQILLATIKKHLSPKTSTPAPVAETPPVAPPATGKMALIVGIDIPMMQTMSKLMLENGYSAQSVNETQQFIPQIITLLPQLLLLEIPLDNITAKDIVKIVRGLPKIAKIPILLYSFHRTSEGGTDDPREKALSIDTTSEECLEAGATAYIGSFNEHHFIKTISKFL